MTHVHPSDRLTSEDAAFLYFEKEEIPMHIGSVSIFDGPIPFESLVKYVESRLPLIPRYRQRLVIPPLHLGHPTWESDPNFDIRNHVFPEKLRRGTETELRELAGRIFSRVMDRAKPLWDLILVDGVRGNRCALIARVHHCLVDGVSGVGLMNVMLNADGREAPEPHASRHHTPPLPRPETAMLDALASAWSETVDRVLATQSAALNIAQTLLTDQALEGFNRLVRLMPELLTPVERLPFNQPLAGPRKVAWTQIAIPQVKAIRESAGGTLNDVVLTVVTGAIRRYALLHHAPVKQRLLRLMVPVNVRAPHESNGLGNRVSMLPVTIPLDISDPLKLLDAVRERTDALKNAHVADVISLMATWAGTTPAPVQALLGPLVALLPVPPFNLVCTNVPGPQFPLYALGREMLTYHPYVPIASEMGVGCAIQSYNHKLYIGLTGDVAAAPDIDRLRKFLDESFVDLSKAAGVVTAPKKKSPRKSVQSQEIPASIKPLTAPLAAAGD